jgi:hypothetical protein
MKTPYADTILMDAANWRGDDLSHRFPSFAPSQGFRNLMLRQLGLSP